MTETQQAKPMDEQEKQTHKDANEQRKNEIRELLQLLQDNYDNFHEFARQFIAKDWMTEKISTIRWFVSHGYFDKDQQAPEFPASNPTVAFIWSELSQGIHTPMTRDIGICLQPVIQNSRDMEHAARRIHDRLYRCLYAHVTQEDIRKDQQAHRDAQLAKKQRRDHAIYEKERRHKKVEVKRWDPEEYLKKKNKRREQARKDREKAKQEAITAFEKEERRLARHGGKA
jgi:flagellar biosynthesis protein FliP